MNCTFILLSYCSVLIDISLNNVLPIFSLAHDIAYEPLFKCYDLINNLKFWYLQRRQLKLDFLAFLCYQDVELTILINRSIQYWWYVQAIFSRNLFFHLGSIALIINATILLREILDEGELWAAFIMHFGHTIN